MTLAFHAEGNGRPSGDPGKSGVAVAWRADARMCPLLSSQALCLLPALALTGLCHCGLSADSGHTAGAGLSPAGSHSFFRRAFYSNNGETEARLLTGFSHTMTMSRAQLTKLKFHL